MAIQRSNSSVVRDSVRLFITMLFSFLFSLFCVFFSDLFVLVFYLWIPQEKFPNMKLELVLVVSHVLRLFLASSVFVTVFFFPFFSPRFLLMMRES
jgi:hypothetical protein